MYTAPLVNEPTIGNTATLNRGFDGQLQEARISDIARSVDWLLTEFNNQDDPSSFYSVGVEDCSPVLAISLLEFNASYNSETKATDLNWQASYDDLDDDGFEIQRSWDAQEFQTLDFIPVEGEFDEIITYNFSDRNVTNFGQTQAFYRLRIIEAGNRISYSEIKRVVLAQEQARITVFPNPSTDRFFKVNITGTSVLPAMEMIQSDGKVLLQIPLKSFNETINIPGIAPGIYILRFYSSELITHKRIIVF
jgi:hypothetical protein